jgi:tight adherence protein B
VLTVVTAVVGPLAFAALVSAGRRAAATERIRGLGPSSRWRIPATLRGRVVDALGAADISIEPEQAVELWAIGVVATSILAGAIAPGLSVPTAVLGVVGGPVALVFGRSRRERRFAAALPGVLEQVAAELRGGGTIAGAIERLASSEHAVAADFRRIHVRTCLGLALSDALATWPSDHDAPGVRAAAGALSVAAAMGGRAADAIDGLAASIRHRLDAAAEARALSSQARLSALVIGVAPVAYLAFASLVDRRSVTALISTGVGRVCLVLGLGLEALAALWIRRIVSSEG